MSEPRSATQYDPRAIPELIHRPASAFIRRTGVMSVVTLLLTVELAGPRSKPVLAGGRLQASPNVQAAEPANVSAFVAEIRWTLKKQHDRLIKLANEMLGSGPTVEDLRYQSVNQQIATKSAEANFENAKLSREVAEIAVVEYEEGIFLQDKASLQGEISLAESDLDRARDAILGTKDRLAQIKRASKGSTTDLANEYAFADAVASANRRLPRAEIAFKQAQSNLKNLVEFTKPKRLKELRSEVEKARSDELAKKAAWELEQSKFKSLNEAIKANDPPGAERKGRDSLDRQARATLERAISVEGQIQAKLEDLAKGGKTDETPRHETLDLTNQLQDLVEQAEAQQSASQFARLKNKIHSAARR